jgi:hypothetical protein
LITTGNGTEMRLACDPAWESSVFEQLFYVRLP